VHEMGSKITPLKPFQGLSAELGGAITVFSAIAMGTPISATHTIAGAISGVGTVKSVSSVRWGTAGEIVFAWMLTLPAAGLMGAGVYGLTRLF
jgi:PiT family inorganic phosphate transporter